MTYILYIIALMLIPVFFNIVFRIWKKDNNIMTIHVSNDFDRKYQEYLIKKKVGFYE